MVPRPLTPQSWNRYAYVLNNPLALRDPTGFDDGGDDEDGPLQSGETLWAPGVTTEEGCLADPACEALHVSHGGPDTPPPTPPQPPRNDDGLGGPGTVGPPINAGLRTQQSRDRRYGSIYPEGEHVALPRWPPGSYTIRSPQGYEYLQDRMLGWVGRDSLAAWTAMDALQSDPNRFFPFRVLGLNGERGIVLGGVYELTNRPGVTLPLPPGRFPVQVTVVTPTSFTFTALYGHFDAPGSTITFLMRTDAAGLFHFEQLGIGRSSESSISDYLYAPSVAAFAWTMQAENVRQWVFSTLSFTQVAP